MCLLHVSFYHPYAAPPASYSYGGWAPSGAMQQSIYQDPQWNCQDYGYRKPAKPRRQGQARLDLLPRCHTVLPSQFGWTHEGTNVQAKVKYWRHPETGVKMDYYPTTGTVKTSMDHPRQGKTQMFRRNLSDKQFEMLLADPRAHTGKGYQFKGTGGYGR